MKQSNGLEILYYKYQSYMFYIYTVSLRNVEKNCNYYYYIYKLQCVHTNLKCSSLAVFTVIERQRQWNHCSHVSQLTQTPVFFVAQIGHLSLSADVRESLDVCFLFGALLVVVGKLECCAGLVVTVNGRTESIIQLWKMSVSFIFYICI